MQLLPLDISDSDALLPSSLANTFFIVGEANHGRILSEEDSARVANFPLTATPDLMPTGVVRSPLVPRALQLFGALLVLLVLLVAARQLHFRPEAMVAPVFELHLSEAKVNLEQDSAQPVLAPPLPLLEKGVSVAPRPQVQPDVELERLPSDSVAEGGVSSPASLLLTKERVLQQWQEENASRESYLRPDTSVHRGTVFDSVLAQKLSQIPPSTSVQVGQMASLPDINGMQEVIIGDHCFQVTKIEGEGMRGMAQWTRGHCQTSSARRNEITLGVLP